MLRTILLVVTSLFAASLVAQEQAYIYVSYKGATGASLRYKLDCHDAQCQVNIKADKHHINLSAAQKKSLLDALQAEAKQFIIAPETVSSDKIMKVKLRYDTAKKRLKIERRLPADQPAGLSPEMLHVIKTHLNLDLSKPVLPKLAEGDEPSAAADTQGPTQ